MTKCLNKKRYMLAVLAFAVSLQIFAQDANVEDLNASPSINDYVSEVTSLVCPFKGDIDYEPERLRCGFISVPENREVPDSRIIRIAFTQIIAKARIEDDEDADTDKSQSDETSDDEERLIPREDPVVYLTGGPGAGMEFYVARFLEHDLTHTRDVFILNQRGIGDSEELCRYYSATNREAIVAGDQLTLEAQDAQRMKNCFEAAAARGVDLSGYNTVENARDVRALRQALGFEQWNVWGISYGSHLGQMLAKIDPEGIRALVLDAIVPNDLGDLMRIHRWIARNHNNIFEECARQGLSICDGLEARFYEAGNNLIAEPELVDAIDVEMFPAGEVSVPAVLVAFAPFAMLYEQDAHPAIPSVIRSLSQIAEERDPEVLQMLANGGAAAFSGISEGMGSAIRCNDGYVAAQASIAEQDLQEDFGFTQGAFTVEGAQLMAQACVDAGLSPRDRSDYQLVQSDIPTLIVNGDWDPVTPPPLAERIAPGFSNGRLIIVPYAGHGPTRSMPECASQVMTDFFDDPSQDLSDLDAACLEQGVDAPEFLDYVQTHMPLKLAARAMEAPKNIAPPIAMASLPIVFSLIGFIMIAWGGLTRRFSSDSSPVPGIGPTGPRMITALSALLLLIGVGLVGAGIAAAFEISEISILAGFAPPAGAGALLILLSGLMGIVALVLTVQAHRNEKLRRRSLVGFILISISALVFSVIMLSWGVTPW